MIQAPIFHVNGDDPEAVVRVAELAFEYRQAFKKDVVIDMVCYRRRGHNEVDEPSFTQPLMYDLIDAKRSVRKLYTEALIGRGDITVEEAEQALRDYQDQLERVFAETRDADSRPRWTTVPDYRRRSRRRPPATAISTEVAQARSATPSVDAARGLHRPPAAAAAAADARARWSTDGGIDWAMGETLAFGSLLMEGRPVRLAGQDTPPRHLRPAPRRARRPADRRRVHAAGAPVRRPGAVLRLRLAALGVRRDGLRVRLLGRPARGAGAVGGAVRRLRQRRPVDHRRVHLRRRGQVGPALRRRAAAPARLRGPGPRPLLGPHRALPADVAPRTT